MATFQAVCFALDILLGIVLVGLAIWANKEKPKKEEPKPKGKLTRKDLLIYIVCCTVLISWLFGWGLTQKDYAQAQVYGYFDVYLMGTCLTVGAILLGILLFTRLGDDTGVQKPINSAEPIKIETGAKHGKKHKKKHKR